MPRAIAEYTAVEKVSVAHELINVLDYGGEFCDDRNDYLLDQCKQDQIQQVKIDLSTAKRVGEFLAGYEKFVQKLKVFNDLQEHKAGDCII